MNKYSRIKAVVDLDAILFNMDSMYKNQEGKAKMIGVIKTDGYGHGALPIAKALIEREYMWGFAVATAEEALSLRRGGIDHPILILGYVFPENLSDLIENEVRLTVFSYEMAKEISDVAKSLGKEAFVHIKIDTGMGRIGFLSDDDNFKASIEEIVRISKLSGLVLEGLFTHFAKADEKEKGPAIAQWERFNKVRDALFKMGLSFLLCHCANSAAIIDHREWGMDARRAGIALYGLYPSDEVKKEAVPLKPALSLISHVVNVKTVLAGTPIGYGGTFVTKNTTEIATIPVGYGDGYPRSLSNKGYVLINGKRAPILGRVCMDQFMVDVSGLHTKIGDEAVLVGKQGEESIEVETLSALSGRFNYEFVCDLGKRIPREYLREGKVVLQVDSI